MRMNVLLLLTGAVLACSAHADGNHKHHFADDVKAFHDKLSPLWHAQASPERSQAVCAATPELASLAGAIKSADASQLRTSIELLGKQCSNNAGNIEQPFSAVHDAFHKLIGE